MDKFKYLTFIMFILIRGLQFKLITKFYCNHMYSNHVIPIWNTLPANYFKIITASTFWKLFKIA